jgi:hypothetical protein
MANSLAPLEYEIILWFCKSLLGKGFRDFLPQLL